MQTQQQSELQQQSMQTLQCQKVQPHMLQTSTACVSYTMTTPMTTEPSTLEQQQLPTQQQSSQLQVMPIVMTETLVGQPLPLHRGNAEQNIELQRLHQLQQPRMQMTTSNIKNCQVNDNTAAISASAAISAPAAIRVTTNPIASH